MQRTHDHAYPPTVPIHPTFLPSSEDAKLGVRIDAFFTLQLGESMMQVLGVQFPGHYWVPKIHTVSGQSAGMRPMNRCQLGRDARFLPLWSKLENQRGALDRSHEVGLVALCTWL